MKYAARLSALLLCVGLGILPSYAQTFPTRPITLVVPYVPGGTNDILARTLAAKMPEQLGQPGIVENKPGATGNIGSAFVAKSQPDGHVLLVSSVASFSINQWLYKTLPYNPDKDFAPITNAGNVPNMLLVHPSVPVSSVAELIKYAKENPGKLNFGSMGTGSTGHLSGELFKMKAGVDMVHVPYKGSAPALQGLLGGEVQIMFDNMPTAIKQAQSGRVKGLALTSLNRHPLAAGIPTLDASGLPGFNVTAWFGVAAPAGTPRPIVDKLNVALVKILRDPKVSENLTQLGLNIVADKPNEFAAFMAAESKK